MIWTNAEADAKHPLISNDSFVHPLHKIIQYT